MAVSEVRRPLYTILISGLLLLSACKDKQEAEIPAYLSIPTITLTTDVSTQGPASHGITDAWVLVDGKIEGVFGLPVNLPLLYDGAHKVDIYAGVRKNGSASYHIIYPLYTVFGSNVNFVRGETVTLNPVVSYINTANFSWLEDFEDQSTSLEPTALNNVDSQALKITNDPNYVFAPGPGSAWSARVQMGPDIGIFEVATKDLYTLPQQGTEVYLEVNVKANIDVEFGLIGINQFQYKRIPQLLAYNTNGEWKKFYISLKESLGAQPADMKYRIFVSATNVNQGFSPEILLDNLKLVHIE